MAVYIAELRQCRLTYYGEDGADKGGSYSVEAKLRDPDFPDADHWVDYEGAVLDLSLYPDAQAETMRVAAEAERSIVRA